MNNKRLSLIPICLALLVFLLPGIIFAETIILKSGRKMEGRIIERTNEYIKIDYEGIPLTCFLDSIESIDGAKLTGSAGNHAKEPRVIAAAESLYKKDFSKAIQQFSAIVKESPADREARHNLACAYALNTDYENALTEFEEAFKSEDSPFKALMLINKAMIYLKSKMYERAADALNKAVGVIPGLNMVDDFEGVHSVCLGLARGTTVTEKINLYIYEDSPVLFDTACFITNPTTKDNLKVYEFFGLEPLPLFFYKSGRAHLLLGRAYFFEQHYDEAEKAFKEALSVTKHNEIVDGLTESAANFFLGWVALKKDNFPAALAFFKKAAELKPHNFGYVRELALGYLVNHDYTKAKEKCEEALKLNPGDKNAKELLKAIQDNIRATAPYQ